MQVIVRSFFLVILVTVVTGCAFGQKINYGGVSNFTVPSDTPKTVGLAVSDKRPAVVAGDHSLQWVGYSRPPLGIPYGVHTESGRPLSDDFAALLQSSLAARGIVAQSVYTQPFEGRELIVARLEGYKNPRNFLVTLNDWKTDSYVGLSVSLHYSVMLEVVDSSGRSLGIATTAGVRTLGSSYPLWQAVQDIFNELFNAPQITSILGVARHSTRLTR
jgi:hypothetical protein